MDGRGGTAPIEDDMPLYEYRCTSCGKAEERLQGFSAPTEHDCPACGAALGMTRQISRTAFALSGGGWYAGGYGDGGSKPAESAPKAEAKPESKPSGDSGAAGCGGGCACH
jgi:putative FmdB family regulatory protein